MPLVPTSCTYEVAALLFQLTSHLQNWFKQKWHWNIIPNLCDHDTAGWWIINFVFMLYHCRSFVNPFIGQFSVIQTSGSLLFVYWVLCCDNPFIVDWNAQKPTSNQWLQCSSTDTAICIPFLVLLSINQDLHQLLSFCRILVFISLIGWFLWVLCFFKPFSLSNQYYFSFLIERLVCAGGKEQEKIQGGTFSFLTWHLFILFIGQQIRYLNGLIGSHSFIVF